MYRLVVIPVIFNSFASLSFQFGLSDGPDIKLIVFVGAKAFLVSWSFLYSYILMSFFFFFCLFVLTLQLFQYQYVVHVFVETSSLYHRSFNP